MKNTRSLKKLKELNPQIAIILGSGFNKSAFELENRQEFSYSELGIKYSNIAGHERKMVIGFYKGIMTVYASRIHYYESGNARDCLQVYEILKEIGVKVIVAVSSVGAINEELNAGDLMLIKSHINLVGDNPLIGVEPIKFLDLQNAYDKDLRALAKRSAKALKIPLYEGIHLQDAGPTYETFAEVAAFKKLGADTVSMSMAFDAISAAYYEMKFLGLAGVVNKAITESSGDLKHEDVVEVANLMAEKFFKILDGMWLKLL